MAFHSDLLALARHAAVDPNPDIRAAAHRILTGDHAIIPEPARTDWAEAITYGDGEVRYLTRWDEAEAREMAAHSNREARPGSARETDVTHAAAVYREVRVLVDGTQIIGPWTAADHLAAEGR